MIDLTQSPHASTSHPYRTAPAPRPFDPDGSRVPYDGQARMRLLCSSGLAHCRVVIDPQARDLLSIECGDGPRPRIQLVDEVLQLTWRSSFGGWLRDMLTPGLGIISNPHPVAEIVLHPAVEWTFAIEGGLAQSALELAAGKLAGLTISGGCSQVLFDLPAPVDAVALQIAGGASHVGIRRPAETGVALDVGGGLVHLKLDEWSLEAVGGSSQLSAGDVTSGAPHYQLAIAGGASHLSIERR